MLQITGKPLDMCPEHCERMEIEINTTRFYTGDGLHYVQNNPRCAHEEICKHAYELGSKSVETNAKDAQEPHDSDLDEIPFGPNDPYNN